MREIVFLFAVGIVALTLQTTSLGFLVPSAYKPDLILALVVWAGLRVTFVPGVGFAFLVGLVMDTLSGSPAGLFALVYCLAFVASGYVDSVVPIDDPVGWAVTVFLASAVAGFLVLMTRWLAGPVEFSAHTFVWILVRSLVTAGAAVAAFLCLDKIWAGYSRIIGER
ncbi:MAG: rod shape-determining protein MreD [Desulfomonile tiedjei]|nr:rod shape-determining protein MreD [Desulfomonile tiedjei]